MEIGFQKKEFPCLTAAVNEVQNAEQTQELRLPDGMPDVGKVLCAWGQTILRGKEWRSDSLTVSGGMLMWVLYAPEDGSECRIVDGWLPFQMRWQLPPELPEGSIRVAPLTRFADARSVSPRKLMLRAGIGVLAQGWIPTKLERWESGTVPEQVELLTRRYPIRLPREAGEKQFSMEEELRLGEPMDGILYYTLRPDILEQKVLGGKIAFRGNGNLHILGRNGAGAVISQDFQLPFSQFAELHESYDPDAQADVICAVTNLEVEQTEGALWVRCTIAAQYLVDQTTLVETVADAYAPGRELNMETKTLEAPAILEKRTETVSSEANLQMDGVQADDILFLPDFPRQYREEGGIALEIPGTVQLLCQGPDGALRAVSSRWEGKLTRPTGEDTALTALPATPPAPQMTVSGGKATLRAELPLSLTTTGGQGIPMVTALALGEDTQPDPQRPSLILRRAGTDSLWELAKATGSTVAAIRCVNKLQDEPGPNQILLIPVS